MPCPNLMVLDHASTFIAEFVASAESDGFLQMPRFNFFEKVQARSIEILTTYVHCTGCRKEWQMDWIKVYGVAAVCAAYLDLMSHWTKVDARFDKTRYNIIIKKLYEYIDPSMLYCGCPPSASQDALRQCWVQFLTRLVEDMRDLHKRYYGLKKAYAIKQHIERDCQEPHDIGSYENFMCKVYRKIKKTLEDPHSTLASKAETVVDVLCASFSYSAEFMTAAKEYSQKYMECFPDANNKPEAGETTHLDLPLLIAATAIDCCRQHMVEDVADKQIEAVFMSMTKFTLDEIKCVREQMMKRPIDPVVRSLSVVESNHVARTENGEERQRLRNEVDEDGDKATIKHYWAKMHEKVDGTSGAGAAAAGGDDE